MKQDQSQGCLNSNYYKGAALGPFAGDGGCSEEGAKKDKMSNKNHPKNYHHISKTLQVQKACDGSLELGLW